MKTIKHFLFLAVLILAPAAWASQGNAVITLTDGMGNPLANEQTVISFFSTPQNFTGGTAVQWRNTYYSDGNGMIVLTNAMSGNWQVRPTDPNTVSFSFYMPVTNGTVAVQSWGTAQAGNTLPGGSVAYDIFASDLRYPSWTAMSNFVSASVLTNTTAATVALNYCQSNGLSLNQPYADIYGMVNILLQNNAWTGAGLIDIGSCYTNHSFNSLFGRAATTGGLAAGSGVISGYQLGSGTSISIPIPDVHQTNTLVFTVTVPGVGTTIGNDLIGLYGANPSTVAERIYFASDHVAPVVNTVGQTETSQAATYTYSGITHWYQVSSGETFTMAYQFVGTNVYAYWDGVYAQSNNFAFAVTNPVTQLIIGQSEGSAAQVSVGAWALYGSILNTNQIVKVGRALRELDPRLDNFVASGDSTSYGWFTIATNSIPYLIVNAGNNASDFYYVNMGQSGTSVEQWTNNLPAIANYKPGGKVRRTVGFISTAYNHWGGALNGNTNPFAVFGEVTNSTAYLNSLGIETWLNDVRPSGVGTLYSNTVPNLSFLQTYDSLLSSNAPLFNRLIQQSRIISAADMNNPAISPDGLHLNGAGSIRVAQAIMGNITPSLAIQNGVGGTSATIDPQGNINTPGNVTSGGTVNSASAVISGVSYSAAFTATGSPGFNGSLNGNANSATTATNAAPGGNIQTNNLITPANQGSIGSVNVLTPAGMQLQPQMDVSGPIYVNANPTTWNYTNTFGVSVAPNATGGHGEIQLSTATIIGTASSSGANVFDGNPYTYWYGGGAGNWVGIDLGVGNTATLTRFRYMPIIDAENDNNAYEYGIVLGLAQSMQDSAGDNPTNLSPQIPAYQWQPRGQMREILCTNLTACASRYFCIKWPSSGGGLSQNNLNNIIAEARLIGTGTLNGQPVQPFISPWGGHFTNNAVVVTIKDISTAAQIYWTTNNWANSNLYTGPFVLTPLGSGQGTGIQLQAIAKDTALTTPLSEGASNAWFYSTGFVPLDDLRDDNGNIIEAHSGGILDDRQNGNGFFWIGDFLNMSENTSGGGNDIEYYPGEFCYHSWDLLNWTFAGQAATNVAGYNGITAWPPSIQWGGLQRFHVVFNAPYHDYVAWAHFGAVQQPVVMTSPTPNGPYSVQSTNSFLTSGIAVTNVADDNLYLDYDGHAYYFCGSNAPSISIWVTQLGSAFTNPIGSSILITNANGIGSRESPAPFRFPYGPGGICFCVNSAGNYYTSTKTFQEAYSFSTNGWLGQWYYGGLLFSNDPVNLAGLVPTNYYNAQISQIFPSPWNSNQLIAVADFWYTNSSSIWNIYTQSYSTNATLRNSRQVWLPLTVSGTTLSIATNSNWELQEWPKVFEVPAANVTLPAYTPLGPGGNMWNSNGVLYWINTVTGHTNYVTGP